MTDADMEQVFREYMSEVLAPVVDEIMTQIDADGKPIMVMPDGIALPQEAKDEIMSQFAEMDSNKDGVLEKHEVMEFLQNTAIAAALPGMKELLAGIKENLREEMGQGFDASDKNGDGVIDQAEFDVALEEAKANGEPEEDIALMDFDAIRGDNDNITRESFIKYYMIATKGKFKEMLMAALKQEEE